MPSSRSSPLPLAFGAMGTLAPLLILWADTTTRPDRLFWGLAASVLSGLVAACVGVVLRDKTSWAVFFVVSVALGTAFGTLVACATFDAGPALLIVVLPVAVACAATLTLASVGIFAAHRRSLALRAGSLLDALERSWVMTAAAVSLVVEAGLVELWAKPSFVRLAISAGATLLVLVAVIRRRHRIEELRGILRRAGAELDESASAPTLHDLGVGDEHWRMGSGSDAYRSAAEPMWVIHGSPVDAGIRARRIYRRDVAAASGALSVLLYLAVTTLSYRAPIEAPPLAEVAAVAPPAPVRTGSWYPGQKPLLVDIDRDGVEDVVSLRWQSSEPASALFVAAHDGASLRPRWASIPVPSQWMSPDTHLVRSGSALFLTTSERRIYFYDLQTGRELRKPRGIDGTSSLCAARGGEPRVWLVQADSLPKGKPGLILRAQGDDAPGERPADCASMARGRAPLGEWDGACAKKLRSQELPTASYFKNGNIGLAIVGYGVAPSAVGYDPRTCARRWQSSLMFSDEAPHERPHLDNQLKGGRLYTLYQLASGAWQVGARDAESGRVLWHHDLPQAERGTNVEELFPSTARVYVARDWRLDVLAAPSGDFLGQI